MNLNGIYETTLKSINNTSGFTGGSSVPPKKNTTTDTFTQTVTFNSEINAAGGINIPSSTDLTINGVQIMSGDLSDGGDIAMKDEANTFTQQCTFNTIPKYNDGTSDHTFLVAAPDTSLSSGDSSSHLTVTGTTHDATSDTHTTSTTTIPVSHLVTTAHAADPTIPAAHLAFATVDPDGAGRAAATIAKKSPYKVVTGNEQGALIGMYITDDAFKPWIMGELTESVVTDNMRLTADKYRHGLVPTGAAYLTDSTQEFLRKDGSWQSINQDLGNIDTHLVSAHNNVHDIGSFGTTFKTLYINDIELEERINLGAGRFISNNQIGEAVNRIPFGYFGSVVANNITCGNSSAAVKIGEWSVSNSSNYSALWHQLANGTTDYGLRLGETVTVLNASSQSQIRVNDNARIIVKSTETQIRTDDIVCGYTDTTNGKIYPKTTNVMDLGTSALKFRNGYFNGDISCSNLTGTTRVYAYKLAGSVYEGHIVPENDNDRDIGSTSKRWKDINCVNLNVSNRINVDFIEINRIFGHLLPFNPAPAQGGPALQQDIGSDTYQWRDLYIEKVKADILHPHFNNSGYLGQSDMRWSEAHIQTVNCNAVNVSNSITAGDILPDSNGDKDIGKSNNKWNTIHCDTLHCDGINVLDPTSHLELGNLTADDITANFSVVVGNSCVASTWAGGGSYATFRHKNNIEAEKYALLSDTAGNTYVNGGTAVYLRVNNDHNTQVSLTATGLTTTENFTCENINCGNVGCANIVCDDISTPVHLTNNIGAQNASFNKGFITYIFGSATPANTSGELQLKSSETNGSGFIHIRHGLIQSSHQIQLSDRRIKNNITPYVDGWEDFKNIQVRTYTRFDETKQRVGVVADEIRDNPVLLISNAYENTGKMELNGETYENFGNVGYETLYRMNLRVTQQLQARVEALETAIFNLINK